MKTASEWLEVLKVVTSATFSSCDSNPVTMTTFLLECCCPSTSIMQNMGCIEEHGNILIMLTVFYLKFFEHPSFGQVAHEIYPSEWKVHSSEISINIMYCWYMFLMAVARLDPCDHFNHTPRFNKVERGVYWYHLVRLSVCGQNRVRSVSSTILIGEFLKFVTLTLSSFDLESNMTQWYW